MRDSAKLSVAAILIGCCGAHFAVLLASSVGLSALTGHFTDALFLALAAFVILATYAIWRRRRRRKKP